MTLTISFRWIEFCSESRATACLFSLLLLIAWGRTWTTLPCMFSIWKFSRSNRTMTPTVWELRKIKGKMNYACNQYHIWGGGVGNLNSPPPRKNVCLSCKNATKMNINKKKLYVFFCMPLPRKKNPFVDNTMCNWKP